MEAVAEEAPPEPLPKEAPPARIQYSPAFDNLNT
jgi:hypothetical protein